MIFSVTALFGLAATLVTVNAQTALPDNCARSYVVRLGDTCDIISDRLNVSTYQLATVNAGVINAECSNLALGMPLCLGLQGEDCATTHTVVAGDGCWQIANDAGTDLNTLFANNPNVAEDCSNIYPGEVLCVAPEVVVI